jgi:hypothetical protein
MVVILGWLTAFATGMAVVYGLHESGEPATRDYLLSYGALNRQAWGFALTWVIFACVHGYGGENQS